MKLQVAIDRVSLDRAKELIEGLAPVVDIVEAGTSLVKDYGLRSLNKGALGASPAKLLIDLKTIDEAQYEFERGFETGADLLTVMGAATTGSLETAVRVADEVHRQAFIDLMEVAPEKLTTIAKWPQAVYGLHHAKDSAAHFSAVDTVAAFHHQFPNLKHLTVAGGIDLATVKALKKQGIVETVIVGSKIVATQDPVASAKEFMEVIAQ